jgi:hypothetical protein
MNVSRFHISCIQKTNYRPYFTVGGPLDRLKHFKRTEQNVIQCPRNGVWVLLIDEGSQCTCAKWQPQCCSGNICNRYLLSEYALYIHTLTWSSKFYNILCARVYECKLNLFIHEECPIKMLTRRQWFKHALYLLGLISLN